MPDLKLVPKSAKTPPPPEPEETSVISSLWMVAHKSLRALLAIEDHAEKTLEEYKKTFHSWLMQTTFRVLSLFMSMMFLILGVFCVAVDYGHIPRGFVLIGGGLLGFLIVRLLTPSRNKITGALKHGSR